MTRLSLSEVREAEFPSLEGGASFLDAASHGLLPLRAVRVVEELTRARGRPRGVESMELGGELHRARQAAARLVGGRPDEIALTPNTSFGVNLAAACVRAGEPGVVLVSEGEFPANVAPWLPLERAGFRVERIPVSPEGWPDEARIRDRLGSGDVRSLALSAVQFHNGYRADLEGLGDLCGQKGALFCVDAIQALGVAPLDVEAAGIDVLATGAQKWLCSPWGSGFTWVRRSLLESFEPPMPSWLAFQGARNLGNLLKDEPGALLADGRRFEPATLGIQDYVAMARSIELFLEVGVEAIRRHVLRLHEPLLELCRARTEVGSATPEPPDRRAGILALEVPDPEETGRALGRAGFLVSVREGLVRFAPHFYNRLSDTEGAAAALDRLLG